MKFAIFETSRQGGRQYNQDRLAYAYSRDALLMVVADGMGGHFHGELAAQIAVQMLVDTFQSQAAPTLEAPLEFLHKGMFNAHRAINDYVLAHRLAEFPRTTCVACVVQHNRAYWAHCGDSRLYYFRAGKPLYRTRDHSLVQQMFERGLIDAAQMAVHPDRNKIYSCLGGDNLPEVELSQGVGMMDNDLLLLCSDGLWGQLEIGEICAILDNYPIADAMPELMDHAELRGGKTGDNLSAIGMRLGDESRYFAERAISAATVPLGASYTSLEQFHSGIEQGPEIEQAVHEIQAIIAKYAKLKPR
ncbi:MAG: protein phosphatase 2C domain-containing protein [Sulfuricellaceae bacterium]